MSKVYFSNFTLEQWELIEPLIPPAKSRERLRKVEVWNVLNAIFYLLTQGYTWRDLLGNSLPWQSVQRYFCTGRKDGTLLRLHDRLRAWVKVSHNRAVSPSEAIVHSQSVKNAAMVNQAMGCETGKQII
ncbi:transposase [Microcoleus sp. herbarium7]|uniref:transposase n=1 Tax=Microcoleus sp. herbarium7 TaxID=3055435 RepID=UPI002FD04AA0